MLPKGFKSVILKVNEQPVYRQKTNDTFYRIRKLLAVIPEWNACQQFHQYTSVAHRCVQISPFCVRKRRESVLSDVPSRISLQSQPSSRSSRHAPEQAKSTCDWHDKKKETRHHKKMRLTIQASRLSHTGYSDVTVASL